MTYSYSEACSSVSGLGNFWKLLFKWRASVYKLIWIDVSIFIFIYYSLGLCYNFLLDGKPKQVFEKVCLYCEAQMSLIPLSFVLGFYVSVVVGRWTTQFTNLPSTDLIAIYVAAGLRGRDTNSRLMRRTIIRYLNAGLIMLMMVICDPVKRRFPTLEHLVAAGVLFEAEKQILDTLQDKVPTYTIFWVPIVWATTIVVRAREQKKIPNDSFAKSIIDRICDFRAACGVLLTYNWITIPLVYTQVVTWAVYAFFLAAVMGRQVLQKDRPSHPIDLYFPLFTILQFLFYMGWLKVAEVLMNPFGDDDDDFEINWLIDRNFQISFAIVDDVPNNTPVMVRDQFWQKVIPDPLPHTPQSEKPHFLNPPMMVNAMTDLSSKTATDSERSRSYFPLTSKSTGQGKNTTGYAFVQNPVTTKFWNRYFPHRLLSDKGGKESLNEQEIGKGDAVAKKSKEKFENQFANNIDPEVLELILTDKHLELKELLTTFSPYFNYYQECEDESVQSDTALDIETDNCAERKDDVEK